MIVMQASEIELVKRLQSGDESAFEELYHTYYARAIAIANRLTHNQSDAQDVVQEAFLQVHQSIHALQEPAYFYSWLHRIIYSKAVNLFYRNRNENAVDPSKMEAVKVYEEKRRYMLPQAESDYNSEQAVLKQLIGQMDEKYQEVLYLAYFKQMKLQEIAEFLDLPLGTVKTRCRRAKQELKSRILTFEKNEKRHITFEANALLPGVALFSWVELRKTFRHKLSDFFMGQAVNVVCVISFTALAISGGVMARQDWQSAKQAEMNDQTQRLIETAESAPTTNFGHYRFGEKEITNSREAYYVLINAAAQTVKPTNAEQDQITLIYQALKAANDQYYRMLVERGLSEQFELLDY